MRLTVDIIPVGLRTIASVGILVRDADTHEPVETLTVVSRTDVVGARARLLDRWANDPTVTEITAPSIPAWAADRYHAEVYQ